MARGTYVECRKCMRRMEREVIEIDGSGQRWRPFKCPECGYTVSIKEGTLDATKTQ